ncbi:zinc-dependent peptidase [Haloferula rosea]|uniref:zinc-dependent peptidase n=1 Tax=Haloferula rosea TaxID=490093 RepID=UPI001907ED62|nr:M90 family metallopeptidase [Haloferula rosea]
MLGIWILMGGVAGLAGMAGLHSARRDRRRESLRAEKLEETDHRMIEELFPIWKVVPDETRALAEGWIQVFLAEKSFEACGDLDEVTHEMRLAIAAPACLLIAHRPQDYYERLKSILVYPVAFKSRDDRDGSETVRLGESWGTGSVVLAWQSVRQGDANPQDGLNVVLHEFAHQIDQADGAADGVPEFELLEDYGRWSQAFAPAYKAFCERVEQGKRSVLDDYGAESPAEFFAVATETFFERARGMKREEPDVYREMARFYQMDPASWGRVPSH